MVKAAKSVGISKDQCLCGKICFEIDTPARWAWHDHSPASRRAHGAAYATYVGSWRKRLRITGGKSGIARYEHKASGTARSFCATCGTQEWAYTGEPLVPLKGFPGVVWQRSKKKKPADRERMF